MSWILSTIPNEKRVFTIENGCREFDLVKEDAEGNVLNNVVHTVTRFSDDPKQNYDQERLLEFALTCDPDVVCVGEMKSVTLSTATSRSVKLVVIAGRASARAFAVRS